MRFLSDVTKLLFFRFLDCELSIQDFEKWVYSSSDDLETELQPDFYFSLISFNYHQKSAVPLLTDLLKKHIIVDEFDIWRTKKLLTDIIEGKIDLVLATRKLRELYLETGENFIPTKLGVGYESVLDEVPVPSEYELWNDEALTQILKITDYYKIDLICDAKRFLDQLNNLT